MSQAFMETAFPLASHEDASRIRGAIEDSLHGENVNPSADDWSDDALVYIRSDWTVVRQFLKDRGIELTPQEESELMDFSSEYASLVDQEADDNELHAMRNEGEN
jgi:hypothetical protein